MPIHTNQTVLLASRVIHKSVIQRRFPVGCSERQKEIRRRRKRRVQLGHLQKRLGKATPSEKLEIVRKLRAMTPGSEVLIASWKLAEVDR